MAKVATARETLLSLRHEIARIEGRLAETLAEPGETASGSMILRRNGRIAEDTLATGAAGLDAALGGGVPLAALTEIHALQTRDAAAASGLALALGALLLRLREKPLLWIGTAEMFREAGFPYAPGLAQGFGIAADRLLVSQAPKLSDALWVAEEAARLPALSAVIVELRGNPRLLDLTATRRLHRRAQEAGRPVFLLRAGAQAEPTAAPVRLVAAPARAAKRRTLLGALDGSIGPPAFRVTVAKSRHSMPAEFTLEWNADERAFHERRSLREHAPDSGAVAALSADRPDQAQAARSVLALKGAA